jgi:hypothetical protein
LFPEAGGRSCEGAGFKCNHCSSFIIALSDLFKFQELIDVLIALPLEAFQFFLASLSGSFFSFLSLLIFTTLPNLSFFFELFTWSRVIAKELDVPPPPAFGFIHWLGTVNISFKSQGAVIYLVVVHPFRQVASKSA